MSALPIQPLAAPLDATVSVPGSKSVTNRALVAAALAEGPSTLEGALFADDTEALAESLVRLGVSVGVEPQRSTVTVEGSGGRIPARSAELDARLSGTTARFLLPMLALGRGRYRLDGAEPLRARPMGPLVEALRQLGGEVVDEGRPGHLPVTVVADGLAGGTIRLSGDVSSQYLSGLLLSAPGMATGLQVELSTSLVSRPYVELTIATMSDFGIDVDRRGDRRFRVPPGRYRGAHRLVEPDASAASYFFAAAALCGGRVRVPGLGRRSAQGDLRFVDVLARMGADVRREDDAIEVLGTGELSGIDVDLSECSDTAQTLAVVAVFASSPTRVRGIGFIRRKETDRIAAVVHELRRCGIAAEEEADGFLVRPGQPRPTRVATYGDHRMAMSFALLGLRVPGIEISDPDCVAKTFPGFFSTLSRLQEGPTARAR